MKFDKQYTKYWASTVTKSVDGTTIAGVNEVKNILHSLRVGSHIKTLDLGCSIGRMHESLAVHSNDVYGVDIDSYAVEQASLRPYKEVRQGSAEKIDFDTGFFDFVFCWAVFDVVDHALGLAEMNRVLKGSGKLLITGKNDTYFDDDMLAFKAEKNAFLKGFPNHFTDLVALLNNLPSLGFSLDRLLLFPRRGDLGNLEFVNQSYEEGEAYHGYEYLIFCHKIGECNSNTLTEEPLDNRFSKTATNLAIKAGFKGPEEFFSVIGID